MPALHRMQTPVNLRQAAQSKVNQTETHLMVKSASQSSSDDAMDLQTPKQLHIPNASRMPVRYESDEESISPCPEDYEDARASLLDIEFDSSLDLDDNEFPSIIDAVSMPIKSARPVVVNISSFAPMDKRSTAAHMRPQFVSNKMSINRPVIARAVNNGPNLVTLKKPPTRKPAPPIPARNGARTPVNVSSSVVAAAAAAATALTGQQRPCLSPRKDSHASRPSVSTIASNFDDDRSSIADSSTDSSAPSSVADDDDMAARKHFLTDEGIDQRIDSVALSRAQEDELERAISDYMMWRSEGSPGEPSESWTSNRQSATRSFYAQQSHGRRFAMDGQNGGNKQGLTGVREEEEEEWIREIEMGLATPTPTTYSAYDPYGMQPPTLRQASSGAKGKAQGQSQGQSPRSPRSPRFEEIPRPSGPMNGLKRGLGMVRRNL